MMGNKAGLTLLVVILGMFGGSAFGDTIYVRVGGIGGGTSWGDAFGGLQGALDGAVSGDEILVGVRIAEGFLLTECYLKSTLYLMGKKKVIFVN